MDSPCPNDSKNIWQSYVCQTDWQRCTVRRERTSLRTKLVISLSFYIIMQCNIPIYKHVSWDHSLDFSGKKLRLKRLRLTWSWSQPRHDLWRHKAQLSLNTIHSKHSTKSPEIFRLRNGIRVRISSSEKSNWAFKNSLQCNREMSTAHPK